MAHEMGHALGLEHAPAQAGCVQIPSLQIPHAGPLFQCGVKRPVLPCDQTGMNAVFQGAIPSQYCPCSGIPCD